jgi:hypothetical protein
MTFGGCGESTAPTQSSDDITNSEYIVLATIVDSLYHYSSDSVLILIDSTCTGIDGYNLDSSLTVTLQYVHQYISTLKSETMQDFKAKNLTSVYIQNPLRIHPACVLSCKIQEHYPIIEVSRVGFSIDGLQALAYVGRTAAPLAGAGYYHVLSKEHGKWIIIGTVVIWIA